MSHFWYVKIGSHTAGPIDSPRLTHEASMGRLARTALVSPSATGPWFPAEKVSGLPFPPKLQVVVDQTPEQQKEEWKKEYRSLSFKMLRRHFYALLFGIASYGLTFVFFYLTVKR